MSLPFLPIYDVRVRSRRQRKLIEHLSRYEIQKHCGVHNDDVDQLFDLLEPLVEHPTRRNGAISAETQVLMCLSFFRSGSFQYVGGTSFGATQSSMSKTLTRMCNSIVSNLMHEYIQFPESPVELNFSKSKFRDIARFPNVIGIIDGTHINIKAPPINEHVFVNRKNRHSINCQIVCDWDNSFKDVVAKWPGSSHDSFIWNQCFLRDKFQDGIFQSSWLLGDSGYGCEHSLLTPYDNPQTRPQERYNQSHKSTRALIECSLGVWKSRWRSMDLTGGNLCYDPTKVCQFIMSTAVLHNFCIRRRIPLIEEDEISLGRYLNHEDTDPQRNQEDGHSGAMIRENVVQTYFS